MRFSPPPPPPPAPQAPAAAPAPEAGGPLDSTLPLTQTPDGAAAVPPEADGTTVERLVASGATAMPASEAETAASPGAEALPPPSSPLPQAPPKTGVSAFVPLLILVLASGTWSAFQLFQLRAEAQTLATMRSNQEGPTRQADRVRQNLDALALQTKKLADGGNQNARLVIEELAKRGVVINPALAASAAKR